MNLLIERKYIGDFLLAFSFKILNDFYPFFCFALIKKKKKCIFLNSCLQNTQTTACSREVRSGQVRSSQGLQGPRAGPRLKEDTSGVMPPSAVTRGQATPLCSPQLSQAQEWTSAAHLSGLLLLWGCDLPVLVAHSRGHPPTLLPRAPAKTPKAHGRGAGRGTSRGNHSCS